MSTLDYYGYPLFLLYWIALKKKDTFKDWMDIARIYEMSYSNEDKKDPVCSAICFIEKYNNIF